MLNNNVISGQTEMTGDVADADELLISDDGTIKRAAFSVLRDAVFSDVSGDAAAAGGALTIANNAVTVAKLADLTRGNIIYGNSSGETTTLSPGSNGQVLTSDGIDISWEDASGGSSISLTDSNTFENSSGQIFQGAEGGAGIIYIKADQGDDAMIHGNLMLQMVF